MNFHMKVLILSTLLWLGLPLFADVVGSKDSTLLERYMGSTIVNYGEVNGTHDFLYGPVDKIKRDVTFENAVRFQALGQKITYEMPRGVSRDRAVEWYRTQLDTKGATMLFSCEGPDCGRATIWASQVFRVRELSAPDRQQTYTSYELNINGNQSFVALYVVERGNKRVIAHIEEIQPQEAVYLSENSGFADQLTATGVAIIQGVEPDGDGSISAQDSEVIGMLAEQMKKIVASELFVVCHIRVAGQAQDMITASQICADKAAEQVAQVTSKKVSGLGVGPLVPVVGRQVNRIEVVVPSLLRQVSQ